MRKYILQDWECVKELGSGTYGKVYEIKQVQGNTTFTDALKVISVPVNKEYLKTLFESGFVQNNEDLNRYLEAQIAMVCQEYEHMNNLREDDNIVQVKEIVRIPHDGWPGEDVCIRMELLSTLYAYLNGRKIDENEVIHIGMDVCRGLDRCQHLDPPLIHRDIKMSNILVDSMHNFKLADFGIATRMRVSEKVFTTAGTEEYMAPEVLKKNGYYVTADIYSLGIVLYKLLNRNLSPFLPTSGTITSSIREEANNKRLRGEVCPAPMMGSQELKDTVLKAISYEPEERYQTAWEFYLQLKLCQELLEKQKEDMEKNAWFLPVNPPVTEKKGAVVIKLPRSTKKKMDQNNSENSHDNSNYLRPATIL